MKTYWLVVSSFSMVLLSVPEFPCIVKYAYFFMLNDALSFAGEIGEEDNEFAEGSKWITYVVEMEPEV